jgi:hypothetical protein
VRLPFLAAAALFVSSACSAPGAPVPLVVADAAGARIHGVRVERSAGSSLVSGWLAGAFLRTRSRREIGIETFDADGRQLAAVRATARRYGASPFHAGVESARFEVDVPDAGNVARIRLSADPR